MAKRIRNRLATTAGIDQRCRMHRWAGLVLVGSCLFVLGLTGCGTVLQNGATEQLLASDAVDSAVSSIDFRPLSGQKVFFETRYIRNLKTIGFVSAEYII